MLYYYTGFPIQYSFAIVNSILILISIWAIGLRFSLRTLYGVGILFIMLSVFPSFITEPLVTDEPFMATVIGGLLCGSGIGLVFTSNGSTGGTDVVAAIINKYANMSIGRAMLMVDVLIITSSYFVFQSIEKIVFGLCVMAVMTYTVDLIVNGVRQSVQFMIISKKHDEIANMINREVNRGVTILDGQGWYSKEPTNVIIVMAKKYESVQIFRLVQNIDPKAFISQSNVIGVYGEGFDHIKIKSPKN